MEQRKSLSEVSNCDLLYDGADRAAEAGAAGTVSGTRGAD